MERIKHNGKIRVGVGSEGKKLIWEKAYVSLAVLSILSFPLISTLLQSAGALEASVDLSSNEGTSSSPQIATSGSSVYVVWQDDDSGNFDILFAASTDDGATFSDPINVSDNEGFSFNSRIATSGSSVYVVWQDSSSGNDDILFAASTDDGASFSDPINVSDNEGTSSSPQIATSGSNVYVVWQDSSSGNDDILFAASTDDGATFSDPINVSDNEGTSSSPQIATSGSNVYVVWQDDDSGNFDILFAASTDDGATFGNVSDISNNTGSSLSSQIATSGSSVYVVWQDDDSGNFDILFAASTDDGTTFSDPINVSDNDGFSVSPRLATFEDNAYLTWSDDTDVSSGFDILFSSSTDDGATFSDPINVSSNDGVSTLPLIATSATGANIYTLWSDNELDGSNDEIYLSTSVDDGTTFGCPINLSGNSGSSASPQLALANDGTNVHATWQDLTTGNFEVLAMGNLDPLSEVIVVNPGFDTTPKWDIDDIEVSGRFANAAATDTVTVEWGDGTLTEDVPISGCSWGPVSHSYDSSAIALNPNILVAKLFAEDDAEKASSLGTEINVQKHFTSLALNSIASVKQGNDVTVNGALVDVDGESQPLAEMDVSFTGAGASELSSVSTDINGVFSSTGSSINATEDGLDVQAHFDGTAIYESAESEIRTYDTADLLAEEFEVVAGSNVVVDLIGFNASVQFKEITSGGSLFVSECDNPDSDRLIPLDSACLRISPGFQMADGSTATITVSFAGREIPDGFSSDNVDLFHEVTTTEGSTIVDVTQSRDIESQTVSGTVTSFSSFVVGIALHDEKAPGHHRTQIFVGDDNLVALRDIENQEDSSATALVSIDKTSYKMTDDPVVTISDSNGNVDPSEADIVYAGVMSETSDPFAIGVTLVETGVDTGVFVGSFSFTRGESSTEDGVLQTSSGDELSVFYVTGARFEAILDGVTESGLVDLSDYIVPEGVCFAPIGGAVNLELVDSQLGSDGSIRVTLSYANADIGANDPSSLRIVHNEDLTWIDVTLESDAHDPIAKTISGEASSAGPFSLATNVGDCGGGAGGGLGFGRGLVVDIVASLANSNSGGGGGGGGSGGNGGGSITSSPGTSSGNALPTGEGVSSTTNVGTESVTLEFEKVESSVGPIVINPVDVTDIVERFDEIRVEQNMNQGIFELDGVTYSTAGTIFDIDSSAVNFADTVDITIPYDENTAIASGSELNMRFLHYDSEINDWSDDTIAIDTSANTVTGKVNSLSPVAAAVVNDGTFDEKYFEFNPLARLTDVNTIEPVNIINSEGIKVTTIGLGENVTITSMMKNLQRSSLNYTYVIEVLDNEGVALDIIAMTGTLDGGEVSEVAYPWIARENGIFTFKIFMIDESITSAPVILKDQSIANLGVT